MGRYIIKVLLISMIAIFCIPLSANAETTAAEGITVEGAKNGIVEIHTGYTDQNGKFYRVKHTSGVVISNLEESAYLLTTTHSVTLSEKEEKKFRKKHNLDKESFNMTASIRVIVKGDVAAELDVVAKSKKQDFCVLRADHVIQEKKAVHLDNAKCDIGDQVYALGFAENAQENSYAGYDASEVEIHEGTIQDPNAKSSGFPYIQHSAVVTSGNSGGALLNAHGYMIGLNTSKKADPKAAAYHAVPIKEIRTILDNYDISYESKERDKALEQLNDFHKKCVKLSENKQYKAEPLEKLRETLDETATVISEQPYALEKIDAAMESLEQAKADLEKKTSKLRIAIYALGAVIMLLAVWLVWLLLSNRKLLAENMGVVDSVSQELPITKKSETVQINNVVDDEKTVIISESSIRARAVLLRDFGGQEIEITKAEYLLGKNVNKVDLAITDNPAVSRTHAVICREDDEYWIYDMHSANGTFVNDIPVDENGTLLNDNDRITLADEQLIFRLKR